MSPPPSYQAATRRTQDTMSSAGDDPSWAPHMIPQGGGRRPQHTIYEPAANQRHNYRHHRDDVEANRVAPPRPRPAPQRGACCGCTPLTVVLGFAA
ncbi:MAG TPA: hypothetical protein VFH51_20775, partial [Myxococcota bacterium]|nr:hypothetical protein [Myxococcota bacterium]